MNLKEPPSERPTRVLHLVHKYTVGGAEAVLGNLCNYSGDRIINKIISFTDYHPDYARSLNGDTQIVSINKQEGNDLSVPKNILKQINSYRADIVHAQGWGTYIEGLVATKMLCRRRCKFIYAFHGKTASDVNIGISQRQKIAQKIASAFADAIITPSYQMADDYANLTGVRRDMVRVIYNGIDISSFNLELQNAKLNIGLHENDFAIGFVGRLDPVKNLTGLIHVFDMFLNKVHKTKRHKIKLLIVGDGSEKDKVSKLTKEMQLTDNVILLGRRDDIPFCLAAMDIFIQPSFYEGHSNTILEAMMSGLPVISTLVGGTPEIIENGKNGFLYDPDNYCGMAGQILSLYGNSELCKSVGMAGRKTVINKFTVEKMVDQYKNLYNDLLENV